MINNLHIDINTNIKEIVFSGSITIDMDLNTVSGLLIKFNVINLKKIERITSIGVAKWIDYFREYFNNYPEKLSKIMIVECASVVIEQYNFVPEFLSWFDIKSVAVPFFCEECGKDVEKVYSVEELKKINDLNIINTVCISCDNYCELSYSAYDYFHFLQR